MRYDRSKSTTNEGPNNTPSMNRNLGKSLSMYHHQQQPAGSNLALSGYAPSYVPKHEQILDHITQKHHKSIHISGKMARIMPN